MRKALVLLAALTFGDAEEAPVPERFCVEKICYRDRSFFCWCSEWGRLEDVPEGVACRCPFKGARKP